MKLYKIPGNPEKRVEYYSPFSNGTYRFKATGNAKYILLSHLGFHEIRKRFEWKFEITPENQKVLGPWTFEAQTYFFWNHLKRKHYTK